MIKRYEFNKRKTKNEMNILKKFSIKITLG